MCKFQTAIYVVCKCWPRYKRLYWCAISFLFYKNNDTLNLSVHFILCFMFICIVLGLFIQEIIQMGIKEVSQHALDLSRLGALSRWDQNWIQRGAQEFWRGESSSSSWAGLCCVKTLHSAGKPDEPFQTLDISTTIVHQLVFSHRSTTTAGRPNTSQCSPSHLRKPLRNTQFHPNQVLSKNSPFTLGGCQNRILTLT